ncbi:MAG: histidine kinase [Rickettsiales bacterium]|jgi:two-component system cell cycle sensor histidine kinase/response regulator CckA|nr:histidine kinase [Rickettsiales bacterium]
MFLERYINPESFLYDKAGFVKRRYGVPPWVILLAYISAFGVVAAIVTFMPPYEDLVLMATGVLFALLAFANIYFYIQKNKVITGVEFQNAIFASAARSGTLFCLIVRKDGSRVYSDQAYNNIFSQFRRRGLRGINPLLESGGLTVEDKDRLVEALAKHKSLVVPFNLNVAETEARELENSDRTSSPVTSHVDVYLHVEPLERPEGYFSVRAVEGGKGTQSAYALLDHLDTACYLAESDGAFIFTNRSFAELCGTTSDTLLTSNARIQDTLSPTTAAPLSGKDALTWSGMATLAGKPSAFFAQHYPLEDADGSMRILGIITPTVPTTAAPSHTISGNILDEGWYTFLESSPIPVALFDNAGNIARVNQAFSSLTGKTGQESKSWSILEVVKAEHQDTVKHLLQAALEAAQSGTNTPKPCDIEITAGGKDVAALLHFSPLSITIENDTLQQIALIGHLIDTTEHKNLELRFVHSQKMQAVGQLAGGIAHDFNNLLTAITGFCDLLLLRHPAGDQSFAEIMQIKQNSARAANLVRQLLAFSRKQTLQPEIINVTDVLAELTNLIRRLIGENIELNMKHGRDVASIKVDQGQFEQVIINLAVNARDAMTDGGSLIIQTANSTIENEASLAKDMIAPAQDEGIVPGDYVQIDVIDNGCGIPRDQINRIFEPFFTTKALGSGTGLGLSTVYGIVNQTGGYIYVASQEGKGTKFSIFLKRASAAEVQSRQTKEKESAEKSTADLTGHGTILLVEDEAPVRTFSAQALTGKGYTVLEAEDGETALDIMKQRGDEVDLIVTDVVMPGMNGPAMIEEVAKLYPSIKVIFMSGYAEDAFGMTYGTERNFNFLPKPFTLKQLAVKVKDVLEVGEVM